MRKLSQPVKVGLIGCGNLGNQLAAYLNYHDVLQLSYLYDSNRKAAMALKDCMNKPAAVTDLDTLVAKSELIIETASPDAAAGLLQELSQHYSQKPAVILSTGGILFNVTLFDALNCGQLYLPSGAIGGLDVLSCIRNEIEFLSITTTKPAAVLSQSDTGNQPETLFKGNVYEAVARFPKNMNVAATLFLATRFNGIEVTVNASPNALFNHHSIVCRGHFGEICLSFDNRPGKNPKTSMLTWYSLVSVLENIVKHHQFIHI